MARTHARILTAIWRNEDFTALSSPAQRLYMLALSQPNLTFAGVVAYTEKRWAALAPDTTPQKVTRGIKELAASGFVVVDEDSEELMIRGFAKHDGILDSPNLIRSMWTAFSEIHSETLRQTFLKGFPEGLPQPFPKGFPERLVKGFAPCAHSPSPSPSPSPAPAPNPSAAEGTWPDDLVVPGAVETESEKRKAGALSERIAQVLRSNGGGKANPRDVVAVVHWALTYLDLKLVDEAVGYAAENAKPRTVAYFAKTFRSWGEQRGVEMPEFGAGS